MEKTKSGFVSIIGRPNVGKSTLMNHLIGQKVAITANKPQTTRNRIETVYTDVRGQAIFLDTPGIHKAKNKLGEFMVTEALRTIGDADVILWIVEAQGFIGKGEMEIAKALEDSKKPVILVINKIDLAGKDKVNEALNNYGALMDFEEIITVSALRAIRVSRVMDSIFKYLPYGPLYYDEDTLTNETMRDLAAEIIREKALRNLNDEIPHGIAVTIEKMTQRKDGMWDIEASVICEKESHKGIIIGKGGQMLKKIGSQSRLDIEEMVQDRCNLKLFVKVRKDWRDNELFLKSFGFSEQK